jgi:hypothetical protein
MFIMPSMTHHRPFTLPTMCCTCKVSRFLGQRLFPVIALLGHSVYYAFDDPPPLTHTLNIALDLRGSSFLGSKVTLRGGAVGHSVYYAFDDSPPFLHALSNALDSQGSSFPGSVVTCCGSAVGQCLLYL